MTHAAVWSAGAGLRLRRTSRMASSITGSSRPAPPPLGRVSRYTVRSTVSCSSRLLPHSIGHEIPRPSSGRSFGVIWADPCRRLCAVAQAISARGRARFDPWPARLLTKAAAAFAFSETACSFEHLDSYGAQIFCSPNSQHFSMRDWSQGGATGAPAPTSGVPGLLTLDQFFLFRMLSRNAAAIIYIDKTLNRNQYRLKSNEHTWLVSYYILHLYFKYKV
jgi:hypothetical protein